MVRELARRHDSAFVGRNVLVYEEFGDRDNRAPSVDVYGAGCGGKNDTRLDLWFVPFGTHWLKADDCTVYWGGRYLRCETSL